VPKFHAIQVYFQQFPTIQLLLHYEQQLKLHPTTQQDQLERTATAKLLAILSAVAVLKRTCTIHCHPRGTDNGICCKKPSRVGEGEDKEVNATNQARDRDDDSENTESDESEVE